VKLEIAQQMVIHESARILYNHSLLRSLNKLRVPKTAFFATPALIRAKK
jgi:hypothetical protein